MVKILLLLFLIQTLSADSNWIPLESFEQKKPKKVTPKNNELKIDITKLQSVKNLSNNLKIIQQLLNKKEDKKEIKSEKNWFILEKSR